MLFNSPAFLLLFLPLSLLLFWAVNKPGQQRRAQLCLLLISIAFYGLWNWRYVPLLGMSMVINWMIGNRLARFPQEKKGLLAMGVGSNLALLGYFKYTNFMIENLNALGWQFSVASIALPLGISFFTFQKIAYLVDCHRGLVQDRDPLRFSLFVLFFPQLVAGPIVHHGEVMPQFRALGKAIPAESIATGLALIIVGLIKKVGIADPIGSIVDPIFASAQSLSFLEAWTGALGYTLQLYFDFSAYSEMAVGIGLLFGIHLPVNFDSPYRAVNIAQFWRRWHITLGRFLRDYLYIPLGGARKGLAVMLCATLATFLLGGLWHGANWTFVLWGAMHGAYLCGYRLWVLLKWRMPAVVACAMTFLGVLVAWVPFRADSLSDAFAIWQSMVGLKAMVFPPVFANAPIALTTAYSALINGIEFVVFVVLATFCMTSRNVHEILREGFAPSRRWAFALSTCWLIAIFSINRPSTFMYWQF